MGQLKQSTQLLETTLVLREHNRMPFQTKDSFILFSLITEFYYINLLMSALNHQFLQLRQTRQGFRYGRQKSRFEPCSKNSFLILAVSSYTIFDLCTIQTLLASTARRHTQDSKASGSQVSVTAMPQA